MSFSERMLQELKVEFPRFKIVNKDDNTLSRLIDICLKVVTLGGQRRYLTHYHTVLGDTLYVPRAWSTMSDIDRAILLRHERIHLRQSRRFTGVGMACLYIFVFFPVGLAWGRARLEWEAYRETLRAIAELRGLKAATCPQLREEIVRRFTGPDYAWMWPFRSQIERWYAHALLELQQANAHNK